MHQRPPRDASLRLPCEDDGERMRGRVVQEVWGDGGVELIISLLAMLFNII